MPVRRIFGHLKKRTFCDLDGSFGSMMRFAKSEIQKSIPNLANLSLNQNLSSKSSKKCF